MPVRRMDAAVSQQFQLVFVESAVVHGISTDSELGVSERRVDAAGGWSGLHSGSHAGARGESDEHSGLALSADHSKRGVHSGWGAGAGAECVDLFDAFTGSWICLSGRCVGLALGRRR